MRFQGLKTIDVFERNALPKNSVALEPGDLEVYFVCVFPTLLRTIFPFLRGRGGGGIQESGRILCCSPIVKTKKIKKGQSPVLFSGVKILMAIVNGKLVHRYAGTPLHQYTDEAVKTKKIKKGHSPVLFSGVKKHKKRPESCSVFRGEDFNGNS